MDLIISSIFENKLTNQLSINKNPWKTFDIFLNGQITLYKGLVLGDSSIESCSWENSHINLVGWLRE